MDSSLALYTLCKAPRPLALHKVHEQHKGKQSGGTIEKATELAAAN